MRSLLVHSRQFSCSTQVNSNRRAKGNTYCMLLRLYPWYCSLTAIAIKAGENTYMPTAQKVSQQASKRDLRENLPFVRFFAPFHVATIHKRTNAHSSDIVLLRLVRSLRVFRIIRLATYIPGFDKILAACTYPSRVLASVFVLLSLGVYIFANVGVALFSSAELQVASM